MWIGRMTATQNLWFSWGDSHAKTFADVRKRETIIASGCTIIGEQTKFIKREFLFVVSASQTFDREKLEATFDAMPPEVRGVVDFERL